MELIDRDNFETQHSKHPQMVRVTHEIYPIPAEPCSGSANRGKPPERDDKPEGM